LFAANASLALWAVVWNGITGRPMIGLIGDAQIETKASLALWAVV